MTAGSLPKSQLAAASGYAFVLLMPTLLVAGVAASRPYLALGIAFLLLPSMRVALGPYRRAHEIPWRESIATMLHWLPVGYAVALIASEITLATWLGIHPSPNIQSMVGISLSLWITLIFGLCSAHELVHRRSRSERYLGAVLAGALGYPPLAFEHLMHHAREGDEELAEWPRFEESVWKFAVRRLARIGSEFVDSLSGSEPNSLAPVPRIHSAAAMLVTAAVAAMFFHLAGPAGLLIYGCAAAGCTLGMQIMTYMQHWALADPRWIGSRAQPLAWEDDCRFQAWITLHISFHQAHHRSASVPFYRLGMDADSPRLPAGYILMMVISLFPPLWRWAMLPALHEWRTNPSVRVSAGRRLTCFGLYPFQANEARPRPNADLR